MQEKRNEVIEIARTQLHVLDPVDYWQDAAAVPPTNYHKYAWCGIFALWCLRQAGLTERKWIAGKGFIWLDDNGKSSKLPYLPIVHPSRCDVGDVVYFDKPFQHYALVEAIEKDWIHVIAGNTPDVDQSKIRATKGQYYSIHRLVERSSQQCLPLKPSKPTGNA
jgi:hypothetical protein